MSKIVIGILDKHKIVQEGLSTLLSVNEDFVTIPVFQTEKQLLIDELKLNGINILIINLHEFSITTLNLITQLNLSYPKSRVLVHSHTDNEEFVLKTIKAGAKGYLDKDAGYLEFSEAIYTIRNGHDYYSKSITSLILNKYIKKMNPKDKMLDSGIEGLSSREVEILTLWGNNFTNKEIADKLFISVRTVESHKNHIMQKLNFKTTVDMIKFGIRNNLIEI
jgi:two-component system response regulator NreC